MKNFIWTLIAVVAVLAGALLLLPEPTRQGPDSASTVERVFITGARVFDGEALIEDATLVIADGRVEALGRDLAVDDRAEIVELSGKTILPGLIDAHVHSFGAARADALRFGVTTMLDMFRPPLDFAQTHAEREARVATDRADLFSAGYLATAAGGHGTQYGIDVPTLGGPEQAADWVAARQAEGSDWIKIVIEPGWGARALPTLDAPTVRALVEAAHARDLLAVAHVSNHDDAMMAIEAGIDGLVHLFGDRRIDRPFIDAALEAGIFVVPTTPVLAAAYGHDDTAWLVDHPVLDPRLSDAQRQNLAARFPGAGADPERWATLKHNIRALHEAGVPILAGSDAPNPGTTYGASVHHALRLLVEAGLTPIEALRAATSAPASAFRLNDGSRPADPRGCLQPGCRADLLIVDGNPATDIEATARIEAVWKNGRPVAHSRPATGASETAGAPAEGPLDLLSTPERWMAAADDYMGGKSSAALDWDADGSARVSGQVAAGYAFPYAGAMWFASPTPMQPVDHSGYRRLRVAVQGAPGEYQVLFFSGESQATPPLQWPIEAGREVIIDLDMVGGLDPTRLRAIGVFASGKPRAVDFAVTEARLE